MSSPNTGTIFCAACGNPVIATAFICPKCGTKIVRPGSGTKEIQGYEAKPKKEYREYKSKERVVYVVLALFFGGFGIHNFYAERNVPAVPAGKVIYSADTGCAAGQFRCSAAKVGRTSSRYA